MGRVITVMSNVFYVSSLCDNCDMRMSKLATFVPYCGNGQTYKKKGKRENR